MKLALGVLLLVPILVLVWPWQLWMRVGQVMLKRGELGFWVNVDFPARGLALLMILVIIAAFVAGSIRK